MTTREKGFRALAEAVSGHRHDGLRAADVNDLDLAIVVPSFGGSLLRIL